jgi:predicted GNAT family acetyltransferase
MPDPRYQVERPVDAQAFLGVAGPYLGEREAEHNLLFGIAATLVADPERSMPAPPYFAAIQRSDEVVAAALMTPPYNLVLSCIDDLEAIPTLAADLDRGRVHVPGVTGPVDAARAFADAWAERYHVTTHRTMAERIYRAERISAPSGVPGTTRIGTPADRDLLLDWMVAFLQEALPGSRRAEAFDMVDSALRSGSRTFWLWEHEGRPVSVAGVTGPTPNGIRVGPVYTPIRDRGHGFASALTAAASQAQLGAGRRFVFLFTDLANPTSNSIYQRIGFEPVVDIDQWTFEPT